MGQKIHLTKDQVDEIYKLFTSKAVKDSDFPATDSISAGDEITILQNALNKRITYSVILQAILDRVAQGIGGKGLSTEDFTTELKNKLIGIESGAEVNILEGVKVNGVDLVIDSNKKVNVLVPDVSQFITKSVDDLVNYYLKNEVYDKDEIDELMAASQNFHYEVYLNRQMVRNPASNVLYLIGPMPAEEGKPEKVDAYQEWIYYRGQWKQIGEASLDLSDYITTEALAETLNDYQEKLVSGTNIKTINGQSIVGSGNLAVGDLNAVKFTSQTLTDAQKTQARTNIGAGIGNGTYSKPDGGIPKTDLASGVQSSLDLADSSVQANPVGSVTPAADPYDYATREELSQLGQEVDGLVKKTRDDNDSDFYIADDSGEVVAKFSGGGVKTKNFDSAQTPKTSASAQTDLDVADENGNIIVRFSGGGIKTKNFDSSTFSKKPYTASWERFKVKINRTPVGVFNSDHEDATDTADAAADEKDVTGVIALPTSYTPTGKPTRLICFCHGTSGNVTDTEWYNNNSLIISHFVPFWLAQGYAVFDCNGVADGMDRYSGTRSAPCGLPDTMQAYLNCYDYLIQNYNFCDKVYIWGCSDGGPVPLNWVFLRPGTIAAIADCDPVIDLKQDAWDGAFADLNLRRQNIAQRLGFANPTSGIYENDRADIWNPFAKIVSIDSKKYAFGFNVPIFLACTASGSYFGSSTFHIREEFAEAIINGGTICKSKWYSTLSHDDVAMGGDDTVLNDVLKWFNRF